MSEYEPGFEDPTDAGHLRLLSVFHYVWAALAGLGGLCFGGLTLWMAFIMPKLFEEMSRKAPPSPGGGPPQGLFDMFGWMYGVWGVIYLVGGLTTCVLSILAARALTARRSRTLCYVASAVNCLALPVGTVLGIFTIIVLSRESVARTFEERAARG